MTTAPVVYFDGVCNLCSRTVRFLLKYDRKQQLRFASLQGPAGQKMLRERKLQKKDFNSFVLEEEGRVYTDSGAALRVFRLMGAPWSLLYVLVIIPVFLRDGIYQLIARKRYNWFGKRESCWIPEHQWSERFLD